MVARAKSRIESSKLYMPMATPPPGKTATSRSNRPAGDVADRAVRGPPHLLQPELGHPGLVRGDGGALDPHAIALDGVCRVHGDLVIGRVPMGDGQVVVLQVYVQVGQDQLVLDE